MVVVIAVAELLRRRIANAWVAALVLAATAWLAWSLAVYASTPFSDLVQASG